jgi:hypothetical protein
MNICRNISATGRHGYDERTGVLVPGLPVLQPAVPAGRPAGARSDPLTKLFAVYLSQGPGASPQTSLVDSGATTEPHGLLGLCRDALKAERIAARLRRTSRLTGLQELGPPAGRIEWAAYDPYHFVPATERPHLTRREAHRRAMIGAAARRAELGLA